MSRRNGIGAQLNNLKRKPKFAALELGVALKNQRAQFGLMLFSILAVIKASDKGQLVRGGSTHERMHDH